MAIESGVCVSYLAECFKGVHEEGDDYHFALYSEAADLSPTTAKYKANNEARGAGYKPGGTKLTGFNVSMHGRCVCLTFDDPKWPLASISAYGGLVYNSSKGNRAVAVVSFEQMVTSTNGPFTASFPAPSADTGIICIEV